MTSWPEMPATVAPVPGRYTGAKDMTNDEAMAILICKAIQFANLAAGEGISIEGLEPETFLFDYSTATGDDEWETLADRTATALTAELESARAERDRFETALGRACLVGGTTYLLERAEAAEALLPLAYEAGRDDAAGVAFNAIVNFPLRTMLTNADNATVLELRIRALPVPADLAARLGGDK